ncbi:MAG: hypothetical protein LBE12_05690, partial [Planctomycetaceae bacterium]|nr:hypothetical protein [Planctomycetaceae bacterium]
MKTTNKSTHDFSNLTFKKIWAMFKETDKKFKETDKKFQATDKKFQETDKKFQETDKKFQETDKKFQATDKKFQATDKKFQETDKKFQETDKKFQETQAEINKLAQSINTFKGEIGHRLGEIAEHLVAPGIVDKFNELGFEFTESSTNVEIKDPVTRTVRFELDILLQNGNSIVVVEVKTKPDLRDVEKLKKRLILFREHRDQVPGKEKRVIYGALAGAVFQKHIIKSALQEGFFV